MQKLIKICLLFLVTSVCHTGFSQSKCENEPLGDSIWIVGKVVDPCYKLEFLSQELENSLRSRALTLDPESLKISNFPIALKSVRQFPLSDWGMPGLFESVQFSAINNQSGNRQIGSTILFSALDNGVSTEKISQNLPAHYNAKQFDTIREGQAHLAADSSKWLMVMGIQACIQCLVPGSRTSDPLYLSK